MSNALFVIRDTSSDPTAVTVERKIADYTVDIAIINGKHRIAKAGAISKMHFQRTGEKISARDVLLDLNYVLTAKHLLNNQFTRLVNEGKLYGVGPGFNTNLNPRIKPIIATATAKKSW